MNPMKKLSAILAGSAFLALGTVSIAQAATITLDLKVPGTSIPWFAGMPDGYRYGSDSAPAQSPTQVLGLSLTPGSTLSLTASGWGGLCETCNWGQGPDGLPNSAYPTGGMNGMSEINAPWASLVGVFLGPDSPQLTPAPSALDFSTIASQDYLTLAPELKQVFFIGDGRTSAGAEQKIIIPTGTSRFYLGMIDGVGAYNNNGAGFDVKIAGLSPSDDSKSVPEPYSIVSLLAVGIVGASSLLKRKQQIS